METDGSGETKQTLLLLPLPLLFLVRLLRRFLVGEKKGKGINRAKRISSPLPRPSAISRLRIQAIPISDKRIIRKSEKLSTLRRSYPPRLRRRRKGNAVDLSLPLSLLSLSGMFPKLANWIPMTDLHFHMGHGVEEKEGGEKLSPQN